MSTEAGLQSQRQRRVWGPLGAAWKTIHTSSNSNIHVTAPHVEPLSPPKPAGSTPVNYLLLLPGIIGPSRCHAWEALTGTLEPSCKARPTPNGSLGRHEVQPNLAHHVAAVLQIADQTYSA